MVTALKPNTLRVFILSLLIICFLTIVSISKAQDSTTSATNTTTTTPKASIKPIKRPAVVKEKMETRKENIKEKIEIIRERTASREAKLKDKLETFRDKQKVAVVERINTNLKTINTNVVAHFQNVLQRLTSLLDKLEARVNSSSPDIKDPVMAKQAITDARAAINAATEVVNSQANKDYTIQLTTESKVKTDVQTVRKLLHEDLKATHQSVNDAKKAVSNAIRISKSGIVEPKEATESGQ